jgi:signal transduction histidine kinase
MVQQVDVGELVRDTVKLVRRVAGSFVVVQIDASDRAVFIEGDDVQLRQVVMNLVTNAFDALGDHPGEMRVSSGAREFDATDLMRIRSGTITSPGRYAFISVSDDGPGIPPGTVERVFEPFYSTKGPGRGLGLAAVIGIVNAHRGAVMVDSSDDHGTTFTVLFPEAVAVVADPAAAGVTL